MPQHKGDCHELCSYCNRKDNAQLDRTKQGDFSNTSSAIPVFSLTVQHSLLFKMILVQAANPNSVITYCATHGTVSALVRAWRERMEGGIRFASPEIRHTGGAMLVRPRPADLARCDGALSLPRSC